MTGSSQPTKEAVVGAVKAVYTHATAPNHLLHAIRHNDVCAVAALMRAVDPATKMSLISPNHVFDRRCEPYKCGFRSSAIVTAQLMGGTAAPSGTASCASR